MLKYEICGYKFSIDANGDHLHENEVTNPVETGWNLYVRFYPDSTYDWDCIYDMDFKTLEEYEVAKAALQLLYPEASLDEY